VISLVDGPHGTELRVQRQGAVQAVVLPVRPDARAARSRARAARRISWIAIDVDEADPARSRGTLVCTPHRLPVSSAVSLPAALGLARLGIPTVVRTGA
jgi:hypothetical protein